MDRLKEAFYYLEGPQNVADFQKFCGVETFIHKPSNERVASAVDCNGVIPENGDAGKPNLRHRNLLDSYSKLNGENVNNKNGFVQNGINGVCHTTKNGVLNGHVRNGFQKDYIQQSTTTGKHLDKSETVSCEIHRKALYYLFCLGSSLGNEQFYMICLPFIMWNLDSKLLRQMAIIWHAGMYLGQAAKDVFRRPRPASPPVVYLEKRYVTEYGMPSTHSTVGAIIPFSLLILSMNQYEYNFSIALTVALLWTTLVGCSRIYLGMHTALDVICGILTACMIMPVILPVVSVCDHLQITHPYAPMVTVLGSFILCFVYPPVKEWNTARGDTATVHGIGSGISFGCWLNHSVGFMYTVPTTLPYIVKSPTIEWALLSTLRIVVGAPIIALGRLAVKESAQRFLCYIYGQDRKDINVLRQMKVETPQKFITYFTISVAATFLCPLLFSYLGIMREAFYTEF